MYSNDGEWTIEAIVKEGLSKGLKVLSVTDHNLVRGTGEALKLCQEAGIVFIPGIEIDCQYQDTDMHLLGYQIDWKHTELLALESKARKKTMEAVPLMIRSLARAGIEIEEEELWAKAGQILPSPELFAEVLLNNPHYHRNKLLQPYLKGGGRSDMPYINFYLDYFAQGKPAYVKIEHMPFEEAIELIKDSGGIPVVAHPGHNFKDSEKLVADLLKKGASGLEVFNNYHRPDQMAYFASLCRRHRSLMTGGSDFHGKTKPLIEIGSFPMLENFQEDLAKSLETLSS